MKHFFLLVMLISIPAGVFAQTAILPYEIVNPSREFNEKTGKDYARILYLSARLSKKIVIDSPDSIEIDIARMKFGRTITQDELELLGRTRHVDYILAGSLAKSGSEYISRSRLYSVHDGKVILDSAVSASSLMSLAEKETREVFATFEGHDLPPGRKAIDLVFLIDSAFNIKSDWPAVKTGIIEFSRTVTDTMSMDSSIYVIPFSRSHGLEKVIVARNSLHSLQAGLDGIVPAGKSSNDDFEKSMKYALRNIQWRDQAEKVIIIVTNGNYENSIELETYAYSASKSGIILFSLLGGNVTDKTLGVMRSLSAPTGGETFTITYHRDIINARGEKRHLFLERGRLFYSQYSRPEWRKGIIKKDPRNPSCEIADENYSEVIASGDHGAVKPETMSAVYQSRGGDPVLKEGTLESSTERVFDAVPDNFQKKYQGANRSLARVLVSDGSASVWITVYEKALMKYLAVSERKKHFFILGLSLQGDDKETYGVKCVPRLYDVRQADVPEMLSVKLGLLLSQKEQFMDAGLSAPPVWFVNVRVERIHSADKRRDVRLP